MHCKKGKKKSHADDHTTAYSDVRSSIKTLQDTVSRLLRINRHPFQSDSIFSATFPIIIYHSNVFSCCSSPTNSKDSYNQACRTEKPTKCQIWLLYFGSRWDIRQLCFFLQFPALFPSVAGGCQMAGAHAMWGRTWTPAAKPPTFCRQHVLVLVPLPQWQPQRCGDWPSQNKANNWLKKMAADLNLTQVEESKPTPQEPHISKLSCPFSRK